MARFPRSMRPLKLEPRWPVLSPCPLQRDDGQQEAHTRGRVGLSDEVAGERHLDTAGDATDFIRPLLEQDVRLVLGPDFLIHPCECGRTAVANPTADTGIGDGATRHRADGPRGLMSSHRAAFGAAGFARWISRGMHSRLGPGARRRLAHGSRAHAAAPGRLRQGCIIEKVATCGGPPRRPPPRRAGVGRFGRGRLARCATALYCASRASGATSSAGPPGVPAIR
jgi:hypothetical protein